MTNDTAQIREAIQVVSHLLDGWPSLQVPPLLARSATTCTSLFSVRIGVGRGAVVVPGVVCLCLRACVPVCICTRVPCRAQLQRVNTPAREVLLFVFPLLRHTCCTLAPADV